MSILNIFKKKPKAPWNKYYTKDELKIEAPDCTMYDYLKKTATKYQSSIAYNYFGKTCTYRDFMKQIDSCTKAFRCQGIRPGDVVTICMPNTPEALISIYALNRIGAIANMIHPLSSEQEVKNYLNSTKSVMLVMIDICYDKIKNIIKETDVYKTIVVSARDSMPLLLGIGYTFTQLIKINRPSRVSEYIYWKDFIHKGIRYNAKCEFKGGKDTPAVILHSGGTTGNPKGIVLSNGNFNVLTEQSYVVFNDVRPGDTALAIMPIFHGFGLGVSMHTVVTYGATIILVPQFNAKRFDKLLRKYRPNLVFGVPTLYEAMINNNHMDDIDLSNLKYIISGGDSLPTALNRKIDVFLSEHGAKVKVCQGYGMTESLAATALAFRGAAKEGSVGIPFPGNYFKIVTPGTQDELPFNNDGEICVSGPTIMLGYLDNEKETNEVLQIHEDGHLWLHTGDIGYMDSDGVIFFKQRIKRMIVSSGYNVYPQYIENVIEEHEAVLKCTVIGIPHPYKMQVAKAYIVLKNDYTDSLSVKSSIKDHCKKNLAKYSLPYEYEFRKSLPKTLIGKIDFKKLQEENIKDK